MGEPGEGRRGLRPPGLSDQLRHEWLDQGEHVLLGDEGHLHVELGELGLPVGPEGLVPEAPDDLVIAVLTGHHQDLLEQLWGLRKGVEGPGRQPGRDQEVAGPLRGAPGEHRRLDLPEPPLVEVPADDPEGMVADGQHAGHLRPPEVQVPVHEPGGILSVHAVLDRERRRLGLGQHLEGGRGHLHLAGPEARVHRPLRSPADLAGHPDHPLRASPVGRGVRVGGLGGMEHDLDDALAVAEVEEDHAAVVAAVRDPPAQRDVPARVLGPQLAGGVRPQARPEIHATTSSVLTDSCSPSARRRTVTVPSLTSRSPTIRA
jgi:hypothetical protein